MNAGLSARAIVAKCRERLDYAQSRLAEKSMQRGGMGRCRRRACHFADAAAMPAQPRASDPSSFPRNRGVGCWRRAESSGMGARPPASSPAGAAQRIDIHHHLAPPAYIPELASRKTGQRPLMDWTPQKSLDVMGKAGIATSMVSISEPGVWFGDEAEARRIARETNDWGAGLVRDYPASSACLRRCRFPISTPACARSRMPWMC